MQRRMTIDYGAMVDELMTRLEIDQAGIAERLGVSQSTISRWRAGKIKLKAEAADKIAVLYRTAIGLPLREDFRASIIKVVGRVGAGAEIMPEFEQVPDEGLFEVEVDFPVRAGAVAFEIEGESQFPRFRAGDVIVCWKVATDPAEPIGWEAAVQTDDGRRYLKIVQAGREDGVYDLASHNAPTIRDQRLVWICEVGLIVPRSAWLLKTRSPQQKTRRAG